MAVFIRCGLTLSFFPSLPAFFLLLWPCSAPCSSSSFSSTVSDEPCSRLYVRRSRRWKLHMKILPRSSFGPPRKSMFLWFILLILLSAVNIFAVCSNWIFLPNASYSEMQCFWIWTENWEYHSLCRLSCVLILLHHLLAVWPNHACFSIFIDILAVVNSLPGPKIHIFWWSVHKSCSFLAEY